MANDPRTITIDPESELAQALEEADHIALRLDVRGVRYRILRENDAPFAGYDPDRVRDSLARYAGSWNDMDAEALKDYIYRGREEGTRPLNRP